MIISKPVIVIKKGNAMSMPDPGNSQPDEFTADLSDDEQHDTFTLLITELDGSDGIDGDSGPYN